MLEYSDAICLIKGRIKFVNEKGAVMGTPLQGQVFLYFGGNVSKFCKVFEKLGKTFVPIVRGGGKMNRRKFKFILAALVLAFGLGIFSVGAWSLSAEVYYLSDMHDNITTLGNTIDAFNSLLNYTDLDALWVQRMDACMYLFEDISSRARNANPPKKFAKSHEEFLRAMDELDAFRFSFVTGMNTKNEVLIQHAQMCWDRMFDSLKRYSEILLLEAGK